MELRPAYKQSAVGVIPEDWGCERIGDAASKKDNAIVGGPFGSDLVSADYAETGVPVIRGQNMSGRFVTGDYVFVSPRKAKSLSANLAYPGDLVFTQRGTLGQVAVVPSDEFDRYLISQSQMKLSLNTARHEPSFVQHYFLSDAGQRQIVLSAIQTGVPHTNLGILRLYRFPAPPLPEQRAIAAALSDVDALLDGLEQLIAKKRDLKQAAMQQLLTGQTRLPGFVGTWGVRELGSDITLFSGQHVLAQHCNERGVGTPYLTGPADFRAGRIKSSKFTAKPGTLCHTGDILITVKGSGVGTLAQADAVYCISRQLMAIRTREWSSSFLFYALLQNATTFKAARTGLIPGLSRADILDLALRLPPEPNEQVAIATVLSDMDAELTALEARRDKTRALKQGMMQELLTGRTRLV